MTIYDTPYEIRLTPEGLNEDLAPRLVQFARELPVYASTYAAKSGRPPELISAEVPCMRCTVDDCIIWPDDLVGRVAHLTTMHGYRMNGHRYNDQNLMLCDDYEDHDWDQPAGRPPTVCIRCDVLKEEVTG